MADDARNGNDYDVRYVDHVGPNSLFRGPLPMTTTAEGRSTFDYPGLKQALQTATTPVGLTVPDDFYLIDLDLMQIESRDDAAAIVVERQYFVDAPSSGEIHIWGMRGTGINVTDRDLTEDVRNNLALHLDDWLEDKLVERVQRIRDWLENGAAGARAPVVIYMHCLGGMDRTGELSGAYYLRYMDMSWKDVNEINKKIAKHTGAACCPCADPGPDNKDITFGANNYRAVQWYCLSLNLQRHFRLSWQENRHASGPDCPDGRNPPCTYRRLQGPG